MFKESLSSLFIRLLVDALEDDRLMRRASRTYRSRANAEKFRRLYQSDLGLAMRQIEPMRGSRRSAPSEPQDLWFR